uniref:Uncharacterized protein n=1 Tax=Anguilla anguilla TaxID=7936 RepID=A0A0E9Q2A6_ANGAN
MNVNISYYSLRITQINENQVIPVLLIRL